MYSNRRKPRFHTTECHEGLARVQVAVHVGARDGHVLPHRKERRAEEEGTEGG